MYNDSKSNQSGSCKFKQHCRKDQKKTRYVEAQKMQKKGYAEKSVDISEKLKKASSIKSVHTFTKKGNSSGQERKWR